MMDFELFKNFIEKFNIKAESKSDESPQDAALRRFKDKCLFILALFVITAAFVLCFIFSCLGFRYNSQFTGIALNGTIGLALAVAGYYVRGKTI